jgi:hypothetical protein
MIIVAMLYHANASTTLITTILPSTSKYQLKASSIIILIVVPLFVPLYLIIDDGVGMRYQFCGVKSDHINFTYAFVSLLSFLSLCDLFQIFQIYLNIRNIPNQLYIAVIQELVRGPAVYALLGLLGSIWSDILVFVDIGFGPYDVYLTRQISQLVYPILYCLAYWTQKKYLMVSTQ